jgi:hypothetical protein
MTNQINYSTLKTFLIDTINGNHSTPNYKQVKDIICKGAGVSQNCTNQILMIVLKSIYEQAGLIGEYNRIVE